MSIRVVLFDLDDTLMDHRGAVNAAITAHRRAALPPSALSDAGEAARWFALEEHHYHRYLAGELDFLGQRRARARDFAADYGVPLDTDAAADAWWTGYWEGYRANWRLHPDAAALLDGLRLPTGIITNGDADSQAGKIAALGLDSRVEHTVASGAVGVRKPDPEIFLLACDLFGVAPADAVYVGDRLATDALGAASAGLLGVWIDRPGTATPGERAAAESAGVRVIRSLSELSALV